MQDAEPPIDFESPYSKLPANVMLPRVKKNVEKSMTFRNKYHADQWKKMFNTEHADAIISDGFWFVICKVFKKGKKVAAALAAQAPPQGGDQLVMAISGAGTTDSFGNHVTYDSYQEFLLDRIAANYVSFTILDDEDLQAFSTAGQDFSSESASELKRKQESKVSRVHRSEHVDFQAQQSVRRKFFEQFFDIIA